MPFDDALSHAPAGKTHFVMRSLIDGSLSVASVVVHDRDRYLADFGTAIVSEHATRAAAEQAAGGSQ